MLIAAIDPREPWGVDAGVRAAIAILEKVIEQDVERDEQGQLRCIRCTDPVLVGLTGAP